MALTESNMMALGSQIPAFSLPDSQGNTATSDPFESAQAAVILFICNHCPYVIHIAPALAKLAAHYQEKGVQFVAINSNDTQAYPEDRFDLMEPERQKQGYPFGYLFDESQNTAKAFDAACTPDLFVFSHNKLVYRGEFDDTRPTRISSGNYNSETAPATGASLAAVLDSLLAGNNSFPNQRPSMGCNIKWK